MRCCGLGVVLLVSEPRKGVSRDSITALPQTLGPAMPRELVTIQIGQCGNQIGWRFWDLAVREHAAASPDGVFDEAMSTFFRNVDERYSVARDVESTIDSTGAAVSKVASLRARAVLVDMEEGVVSQVVSGPLRDLFDDSQVITDVSGSGNNW